jgi:hypothetical protein
MPFSKKTARAIWMVAVLSLPLVGCGPKGQIGRGDNRRVVPGHGSAEWGSAATLDSSALDSLAQLWTAALILPDPLIGAANNAKVIVRAVHYGWPLLEATVAAQCQADSLTTEGCDSLLAAYRDTHRDSTEFRIDLKLESNFSEKSLQPRFWDMFIEDDDKIMYEPVRFEAEPVVAVKKDTLSEPGRANILGGPYRRLVHLYFSRISPMGGPLLSAETEQLRLVFSRNRMRLGEAIWVFDRPGEATGLKKTGRRASRLRSY